MRFFLDVLLLFVQLKQTRHGWVGGWVGGERQPHTNLGKTFSAARRGIEKPPCVLVSLAVKVLQKYSVGCLLAAANSEPEKGDSCCLHSQYTIIGFQQFFQVQMGGSQLNNLHSLTIIDNNSNLNVTKEDHVYQTHTHVGEQGEEKDIIITLHLQSYLWVLRSSVHRLHLFPHPPARNTQS